MTSNESPQHLSERVLSAIDEGGITPKPRWQFLLHEWVVWLFAVVAFALGSVATALTLYITNTSTFMERQIALSPLDTVFEIVPFIWLALLVIGIFYAAHALHSTRRGYRWHTSWLVVLAIGVSFAAGYGLDAAGLSASIDRYLLVHAPLYQPLTGFKPIHWMDPRSGVIAGTVEEVGDDMFVLRSLEGVVLEIHITPDTTIHGFIHLREGLPVRVVGTSTSRDGLDASDVGPFHGRGAGKGPSREAGPR